VERRHLTASTALIGFTTWPGLQQVFPIERRIITKRTGERCWPTVVPPLTSYLSCAPPDTPLAELGRACGLRWPIERCFEAGKVELGLDHYDGRFLRGWRYHMTLVILTYHFLVLPHQRVGQRGGLSADQPPLRLAIPLGGQAVPPRLILPLSLAQVRLLLGVVLPLPPRDLPAILALLPCQQQRKLAAYRSPHKRRLRRLESPTQPP